MENDSPRDRVQEDSRTTTTGLQVAVAGNGTPRNSVICSRFPAIRTFPKSR